MAEKKVGIFGGSGFYLFLDNVKEIKVETPYGSPSDKLAIATYKGQEVLFLPRHGKDHSIPPHAINYRANLWAFKSLGVTHIISPSAAGSLRKEIKPGEFVVMDQFVDRTKKRLDTFYDGPITTHISCAEPYCNALREVANAAISELDIPYHKTGTCVVIEGPRFSSKAESQWFSKMGWDVVNMTQYPEVVLAKELELCYINISLITDYDSGVEGVEPVPVEEMLRVFKQNMDNIQRVIFNIMDKIGTTNPCQCGATLSLSRFND